MAKCDDGGDGAAVSGGVRGLSARAGKHGVFPSVPSPASPTAASSPPPQITLLLRPLPSSIPAPALLLQSAGVVGVSSSNIVVSTKSETTTTTASFVHSAVVPACSNDGRGAVDVPADLAGTTNLGTPTNPPHATVAVLRERDGEAPNDGRAGVHDDVGVSRSLDAWRPAPCLTRDEAIDAIKGKTRMSLEWHWSDPRTSDGSG